MVFEVQWWMFGTEGDEEPSEDGIAESREFEEFDQAMKYAEKGLEAGFFVRLWKRQF